MITGGRSSEHEISVASARSVAGALAASGWEVVTVEIDRDGGWALAAGAAGERSSAGDRKADERSRGCPTGRWPRALGGVDVVFPVLHGPHGEDGTVQGLLELAGVPYVGAGVAASALCMDKDLFKSVLRDHGIPVTRNVTLRLGDAPRESVRLPRLRQARAARLVGRHLEGTRRRRAGGGGRARLRARREGARGGVRPRRSRSRSACSAARRPSRRFRARSR